MFRKPYKLKSNNQLKGSDRKIIKDLIIKSFPQITETELENILPKKEAVQVAKVQCANGESVQIYLVDQRPLFFIVNEVLFPTIFLLWKYPDLMPNFTTHQQVFSNYIQSGADLMLPGVVTPPTHSGLSKYGNFAEKQPAYLNLVNNKAALAVGITAQSSLEMLASGQKGKCLIIYHLYGDKLCSFKTNIPPVPNLGPPEWLKMKDYEEDFPALGAASNKNTNNINQAESDDVGAAATCASVQDETNAEEIEKITDNLNNLVNTSETESTTSMTVEEMDQLLLYCFLAVVKYSKNLQLPILCCNFYKLHMVPVCPEGKRLDLKKTSYKKLKPFLDLMAKENIITMVESKKGVESITSINHDHPKVTEFFLEEKLRPKTDKTSTDPKPSTMVTESYMITQNVLPLFSEFGYRKNDTLQVSEIRKCVTEYVKKYECQNTEDKRYVQPKEHLLKIFKTSNNVTWEEVFEKVCESMKNCYTVANEIEEIKNKGKISPITMTLSKRANSKKVTLVDNLELFGIRIEDFAKECQHGVAASTSINRIPGKTSQQLLIQGNQILFVYNLLKDKYKIPIKYIKGLENAPKKKK